MARPRKTGLDYFPLDCVMDTKIEMLEAQHGLEGFAVYIKLLQEIYQTEDASLELTPLLCKVLGKRMNLREKRWRSILNSCLELKLFDSETFHETGRLSSNGVRNRFASVQKHRDTERIRRVVKIDPEGFSGGKTPQKLRRNSAETPERKGDTNVSPKGKDLLPVGSKRARDGTELFGEYVRLKPEEHAQLCKIFGPDCVTAELANYDRWIGTSPSGKSQKPHTLPDANNYLGALSWIKRAKANGEGSFAPNNGQHQNGGRILLTAAEQAEQRMVERMRLAQEHDDRQVMMHAQERLK